MAVYISHGMVATCAGARERAQAVRLLHRRHLLLAGRLALRHVVHLHMVVDSFGAGEVVRLSARLLLGYRRGSCCARGPQGTARDGMRMRTGMAGASLLLTLVWIVFTGVSSSRSDSGSAAGIWCSDIIFTRGQKINSLVTGILQQRYTRYLSQA